MAIRAPDVAYNLYKMQLLPHQTMHRDNFGLKSGFVSSGTKGSSGPRSQLPTCRAGIQLNLPSTGEESEEEKAIFLVQNAIFLPTTHLQYSHTIISVFSWKGQSSCKSSSGDVKPAQISQNFRGGYLLLQPILTSLLVSQPIETVTLSKSILLSS